MNIESNSINTLKKTDMTHEKTRVKETGIDRITNLHMTKVSAGEKSDIPKVLIATVMIQNWEKHIIVRFKDGPELVRIAASEAQIREIGTACDPSIALKVAALQGNVETVRKLKQEGISVDPSINAKDNNGCTALMRAVKRKDISNVQALMEAGADCTMCNDKGETAWMIGLSHFTENMNHLGNMKLMRVLLEGAGDKIAHLINQQDPLNGKTALMLAVEHGNIEDVQALKIADADMTIRDKNGYTALMRAAATQRPNLRIMKALTGIGDNIEDLLKMMTTPDPQTGHTPFMISLMHDSSVWSWGLESDVLVRLMSVRDQQGYTPIMRAIVSGEFDVALSLINHLSTKEHCNACHEKNGETVLMMAVKTENAELVRKLIEKGANVDVKNLQGETALRYAVQQGNVEIVRMLTKAGANINTADNDGYTPLTYEILQHGSHTEMAHVLKECGANEEYALECIRRVWLAHVWGISDESVESQLEGNKIRLEGFFSRPMLRIFAENVTEFFSKNKKDIDRLLSKTSQQEIHECILHSNLFKDDVGRIKQIVQSGKPFVILGGSAPGPGNPTGRGHTVAIVLYKNELIICNRGAGKPTVGDFFEFGEWETFEVERFSLPSGKVNEELINKLKNRYADNEYSTGIDTFNSMIRKELGLRRIGGYKQKEQKVGNCTWASTKGAVGILFRIHADPNWGTPKENKKATQGIELYKLFTGWIRTEKLRQYMKESKNPDPKLLQAIKTKCEGKPGLSEAKALLGVKGVFGQAGAKMKHFITMHLPKKET